MDDVPAWERRAARLVGSLAAAIDARRAAPAGGRQIAAYRGYGTDRSVLVRGRVLANPVLPAVAAEDRWWRNLANTYRRLETDEVPGATVDIRFYGARLEAVTDREGFFHGRLAPRTEPLADRSWHAADLALTHGLHPDVTAVRARAEVLIPPASAAFGVISDLDDTVIQTGATSVLRMLWGVALKNARTRLPFPGVAAFYRALWRGRTGSERNPIFFVSSSPWNLYDSLVEFLEHQGVPAAPLYLRDWGLMGRGLLPTRHGRHKRAAIDQILETYPALPFLLIGDSGQADPEIYRDVMHEVPERVLAIYIRNVTPGPLRRRAIEALAEEVEAVGGVLVLSDDTLASARHAAARGWIDPSAMAEIEAEQTVDSAGHEDGTTLVVDERGRHGESRA